MSSTVAIANHNLIVTGEFELPDAYKPRWFAVHTRSRHEKSASELLRRKDIETFLPLYHSTRRWQNGDHEVHLPLLDRKSTRLNSSHPSISYAVFCLKKKKIKKKCILM